MIKSKLRAGSFLNFVVEIFSGSAFFMILRSSSGMLPGVDKHLLKGRSCNSSIHKWNGNVCSLMHNTNRSNSNTFISLCSSNRHSSGKPRPGSVILSSLPSRMPSRQDLVMRSCPAVAQSGMRWDDEMNSFDTRCQRQRGSRMSCSILQKKKQNQNLSVLFSPGNSHDVSPRQSLVTEVCSTFGFPFDPFWITPALASTLDPPPPTTTSSFNPQLCFTKSLQSAFAQAFSVTGPHHDSQEDGLHRSCNHTTLQKKKKKIFALLAHPSSWQMLPLHPTSLLSTEFITCPHQEELHSFWLTSPVVFSRQQAEAWWIVDTSLFLESHQFSNLFWWLGHGLTVGGGGDQVLNNNMAIGSGYATSLQFIGASCTFLVNLQTGLALWLLLWRTKL